MHKTEEIYKELEAQSDPASAPDKRLIWHYTSWESFEGIIASKALWATQLEYLNDKSELRHAFELSKDVFKGTHGYWDSRINEALKNPGHGLGELFFVSSLSQSFDSLTQWQQYSRGSIGIAAGFSSERLQAIAERYGFRTKPCIYRLQDKQDALEARRSERECWLRANRAKLTNPALTGRERYMAQKAAPRSDVGSWGDFIATALTFKDEKFITEEEVRLFFSPIRRSLPNLERKFRRRDKLLVPHIEIPFEKLGLDYTPPDAKDIPHPLEAAVVGPVPESELTLRALKSFLCSHELPDVKVCGSAVPIRA